MARTSMLWKDLSLNYWILTVTWPLVSGCQHSADSAEYMSGTALGIPGFGLLVLKPELFNINSEKKYIYTGSPKSLNSDGKTDRPKTIAAHSYLFISFIC